MKLRDKLIYLTIVVLILVLPLSWDAHGKGGLKAKSNLRILNDRANVSLFKFWLGVNDWANLLAWLFITPRYLALILIIVGCLISKPDKSNGFTRLVRYVSFIYGTTYFYYNLTKFSNWNKEEFFCTGDMETIYHIYNFKSAFRLVSWERGDFLPNI